MDSNSVLPKPVKTLYPLPLPTFPGSLSVQLSILSSSSSSSSSSFFSSSSSSSLLDSSQSPSPSPTSRPYPASSPRNTNSSVGNLKDPVSSPEEESAKLPNQTRQWGRGGRAIAARNLSAASIDFGPPPGPPDDGTSEKRTSEKRRSPQPERIRSKKPAPGIDIGPPPGPPDDGSSARRTSTDRGRGKPISKKPEDWDGEADKPITRSSSVYTSNGSRTVSGRRGRRGGAGFGRGEYGRDRSNSGQNEGPRDESRDWGTNPST